MSYDATYSDPSIDPFAQTAGTDDLFFDDDIIPISEPVVEQSTLGAEAPEFVPAPQQAAPPTAPQSQLPAHTPREPRNADRGGRGRGRGNKRGRGRGGRGGHNVDIREDVEKKVMNLGAKEQEPPQAATPEAATENAESSSAPTDPKEKPTHSVRGDRTLTGGNKRTRMTEEQLNAKLASMRSKNEALQTAHARAEADQANFEAREAVLKQQEVERKRLQAEKQKADRQNRQQMMGEREKNRQRKLNAQQGREWDFQKEDGFDGTGEERRRGAQRGAHGGVASSRHAVPSADFHEETHESHSQRGGGRGRGRGGRGGRGGHASSSRPDGRHGAESHQHPPTTADFPELPSAAQAASKSADAPKTLDFPIKGAAETKTAAKPETKLDTSTEAAPERPGISKQDSFGLPSPMAKGQSWADDV